MTVARAERRSAGPETLVDVLLRWAWIRRRTPARDIADFDGGQPLRVVGFTQSIGGTAQSGRSSPEANGEVQRARGRGRAGVAHSIGVQGVAKSH
nr:hypothetical protein [Streptomyces sp. RLB1-33]QIY67920.1 hypothetical protein HEP84_08365 [Streptomyces sp. RLB1-33]